MQKTLMLKRRSYKFVAGKNLMYCNKRDGENVGHIIQNLVIINGEFQMEKFRTVPNWS